MPALCGFEAYVSFYTKCTGECSMYCITACSSYPLLWECNAEHGKLVYNDHLTFFCRTSWIQGGPITIELNSLKLNNL